MNVDGTEEKPLLVDEKGNPIDPQLLKAQEPPQRRGGGKGTNGP